MRVSLPDLLAAGQGAVGAFTCYDLETASAVLTACAEATVPAMLLIAPNTFASAVGEHLMRSLVACANAAPIPALVELDHASDLGLIERALALGAGAVMADGSKLPLQANTAFVRDAVRLARRHGAHVECELGHLAGDEDRAHAVEAGALTDPADAADLIERSGADCLAISIGNVHGHYIEAPVLDFDRLMEIERRVNVPLALHGASGIPADAIRASIACGIRKINVNTELRGAYLGATKNALTTVLAPLDLASLHSFQREAVGLAVAEKLEVFRPGPLQFPTLKRNI